MSGTGQDLEHAGGHGENPLAPGLPEHTPRRADVDPRAARRAERQVATLFGVAALAFIGFVVAYVAFPVNHLTTVPVIGEVSSSNLFLGLTLGIGIFCIGVGAIHWAKKLMPDVEEVSERHELRGSDEDRTESAAAFGRGTAESGFTTRPLIRRTLLTAMVLLPVPLVVLLRDLGPLPEKRLRTTLWAKGTRIVSDVTLQPIKPADIPPGGLVSCVPEGLDKVEEEQGNLNARAKAPIILVRMRPDQIRSEQGKNWDYEGILAYSKICTHVGCPAALYEQQTHHLLCPCHQSTFDLSDSGNVVFGPAARRMPQLAITVDADGYLVAQGPFTEPVGPSFWERG